MISAVNKQYVYRLFVVALIGIKFCMYADTNVTIQELNFQNIGLKIDIKLHKNRFAYNSWTQCKVYIMFNVFSLINDQG